MCTGGKICGREHVLTRQHENQQIFLKGAAHCDSFSSQAACWYVCERTPYALCSLDHTTHFLLAPWDTRRSCQKQIGAHGRKCTLTTTTHHAQAAGETACMHEEGPGAPRPIGKGGSDMETSALPRSTRYEARVGIVSSSACTGSAGQRPLHTSPR